MGLQRVQTAALGNCQFEAVVNTLGLGINAFSLLQKVVGCMRHLPRMFGEAFLGFSTYDDYLNYMNQDGSWGGHLTATAISHLLLRPICVVTDALAEDQAMMFAEPPEIISREAWGLHLLLGALRRVSLRSNRKCNAQERNGQVRAI